MIEDDLILWLIKFKFTFNVFQYYFAIHNIVIILKIF